MKKIIFALFTLGVFQLNAQCLVSIEPETPITCAGNPVGLSALYYDSSTFIVNIDFDINFLPATWSTSFVGAASQTCYSGIDTSDYIWSNTSNSSRHITSGVLDLTNATAVYFDLGFGIQGANVPCDGPDNNNEGVQFEYSVNGGITWIPIRYFDPDGTEYTSYLQAGNQIANSLLNQINWFSNGIVLPPGAKTPNTILRWRQYYYSASDYDKWGIDNIRIQGYVNSAVNVVFNWSNGMSNASTISVSPNSDSLIVLNVLDTLSGSACSDTVLIEIPGFTDYGVQLISSVCVPGQVSHFQLEAYNEGCQVTPAQLTLVLDSNLNFIDAAIIPDVISGDTLIWDNLSIAQGLPHFETYISVSCDPNMQDGDSLLVHVMIEDIINDADPSDNIKDYIVPVSASFDPNNKQVYPHGECIPNFVLDTTTLTYTVRFQNTGSSAAYLVKVFDFLDSDLDYSSLRVITASSPYEVQSFNGGVVFVFDQIMLPPNSVSSLGSIGYIVYEIDQLPGLGFGTELISHADIYFDYNTPVTTNQTFNTVSDGSHITSIQNIELNDCDSLLFNGHYYFHNDSITVYDQNSYGCDSIVHYYFTVKHSSSETITVNDALPVSVNGQTYANYGTYQQLMTNEAGCDSVLTIVVTDQPAMVSTLNEDNIIISPNPTVDYLKIEGLKPEGIDIRLIDSEGKEILSEQNTCIVDVSSVNSGQYILRISSSNKIYDYRIVVVE